MAYNCTEHGTVTSIKKVAEKDINGEPISNEGTDIVYLFCFQCYLEHLRGTRTIVNEVTEE